MRTACLLVLSLLGLPVAAATELAGPPMQAPTLRIENTDAQRVSGSKPVYPVAAADRHVDGFVDMLVTTDGKGAVVKTQVVKEEPAGYGFAESAMQAMPTWVFAQKNRYFTYRMTFKARPVP